MKKLIIFDCDGTLVDSEYIASNVFPSVWSKMGLQMDQDFFICNFVGVSNEAEIVKHTLAKLPANAMAVADEIFHNELQSNLTAVSGIYELLEKLERQMCVASNSSSKYLEQVLRKTNLEKFFGPRVYSAHQIKKPKPAPDLFLHAAQELGYAPSECVVVEDSVAGVTAAKSAGMKVIGFMGGLHFNQVVRNRLLGANADIYCNNASELHEHLK